MIFTLSCQFIGYILPHPSTANNLLKEKISEFKVAKMP